jgi:hypothetical protein
VTHTQLPAQNQNTHEYRFPKQMDVYNIIPFFEHQLDVQVSNDALAAI